MGSHVGEEPLQLRFRFSRLVPPGQNANPRSTMGRNAVFGIGLWALLRLGYNTSYGHLLEPRFPATSEDLIHGIRVVVNRPLI